jgi:cytochrome c oxidase subunit 1/cytochrome c oxidase subunit I+III
MSQIVDAGVAPAVVASEREGLLAWVASVDHKQLGILYIISAMVFFFAGGIEALVIRLQLLAPGLHIISPETFDQMFTMHGTTMIFLFVMPMLTGFSTYVVPLMIGARDMAFPRLNALSFWIQLFGGVILYFSFLAGGAPNAGWFSYTPLSEKAYSSLAGVDYWIVGIACIGIGTLAAAINFVVTIICLRVPGLTIRRLPLFVWMTLVNSFLMVGALPLINAALAMLLIDRFFNAHVFDPAGGGDAILWQHYFWAFGHPEVYIMILPAFGIISEVIPVFSGKPIYGYEFVAASSVAIAFLSFTVWAHHMFAVGMSPAANLAFGISSMLIAVPTGIKIFNWTATMYGGRLRFTTAMMFAVAFLIVFTIGGLSGISFAIFPLDWQLTDTYYLVAHFHYVLFGGSVFGIFAGFYYWFPKMSGRMLSERIGVWQFWLTFIGFNMTFFIQHILGLACMPRRIFTYPDLPGWAVMNQISSIGAFILGFSVLLFVWNIYVSLGSGEVAGDNPWDAWTLEWATTSPPPPENFNRVPPVRGRRPLWDLAHPDRADEMVAKA